MFFIPEVPLKRGKKVLDNFFYFSEAGGLDCNQYVITNKSKEIALIDMGNARTLKGLIEGMKQLDLDYMNITKLFLTHEHVDHVLGIYPLMELLKDNPPDIFAYGETAKIIKEGDVSQIFPVFVMIFNQNLTIFFVIYVTNIS